MRFKVILFGGTFDPIHYGHIALAKAALKQRQANEVWFVPTVQNPLKDLSKAAFEHRAQMIQLMIRPYRKFKLERIEAHLDQPSYTIDTVKALMSRHPNIEFEWLMGSDQALDFERWKEPEELKSLISLLVFPRDRNVTYPKGMIPLVLGQIRPESSHAIRQGMIQFTSKDVLRYALSHRLYLETWVQNQLSEKRFQHSLRVTKLALLLAHENHLDEDAVYCAAMFHDIAKEWPRERLHSWLLFFNPKYVTMPEALWHQKVGAKVASRMYGIQNHSILKAIAHHIEGTCADPIAQIVYIADKCEPGRGYDAQAYISLAQSDLAKAVRELQINQEKYVKENQ